MLFTNISSDIFEFLLFSFSRIYVRSSQKYTGRLETRHVHNTFKKSVGTLLFYGSHKHPHTLMSFAGTYVPSFAHMRTHLIIYIIYSTFLSANLRSTYVQHLLPDIFRLWLTPPPTILRNLGNQIPLLKLILRQNV